MNNIGDQSSGLDRRIDELYDSKTLWFIGDVMLFDLFDMILVEEVSSINRFVSSFASAIELIDNGSSASAIEPIDDGLLAIFAYQVFGVNPLLLTCSHGSYSNNDSLKSI